MTGPVGTGVSSRLIGVANAALGAALLGRPQGVARAAAGDARPTAAVVRLLGARYLVQGAAQVARPIPAVLQLSVAVDALHAASMLALAAVRADYRRPALISAAIAGAGAAVTSLQVSRVHRSGR